LYPRFHPAVGCSHCQGLRATVTCPSCRRPVCPRCRLEWSSCREPHAQTLDLGAGRTLRSVDAEGRLALVAGWAGWRPRLLDLPAGRWLASQIRVAPDELWPDLAPGAELVRAAVHPATGDLLGVELEALRTPLAPRRPLACAAAGCVRELRVSDEGRLVLLLLGHELRLCDLHGDRPPLAIRYRGRRPAVAASSALGLVSVGGARRLRLHHLGSRRPCAELAHGRGPLLWIGLGAGRLACIDEQGWLLAYELEPPGALGRGPSYLARVGCPDPAQVSLSRDGRLLALAAGDGS